MMTEEEQTIVLPPRYLHWERDGWHLFFDPANFKWARVNESGRKVIEAAARQGKLQAIIAEIARHYRVSPSQVAEKANRFLDQMIQAGFLHRGTYAPAETKEKAEVTHPIGVYLHPTFRCNLRCVYCYNQEERTEFDHTREMSTDSFLRIIDQLSQCGVKGVVFSGGEPLLHPDLLRMAARVRERGMTSQVLTNGTLIDERNAAEIAQAFDSISISLDSPVPEENDGQRGKGSFQRAVRAIRLLTGIDRKKVSIGAVITKHNVHTLLDLWRFVLEDLGCATLNPTLYVPGSFDEIDLLPSFEDYLEATQISFEYLNSLKGPEQDYQLGQFTSIERRYQCGAGWAGVSVAPDGEVYPCQALQKEELRCGNILEKGLMEIYTHSPILQRFRRATVDRIEGCGDCDLLEICGGGCRALAYGLYRRVEAHNAFFCGFLREMSIDRLWRAASVPLDQLSKRPAQSSHVQSTPECL